MAFNSTLFSFLRLQSSRFLFVFLIITSLSAFSRADEGLGDVQAESKEINQAQWVIEPALVSKAAAESMLDVIIYLRNNTAGDLSAKKNAYAVNVEEISTQLRQLDSQYRILDSLPEDQEKEFVLTNGIIPREVTEDQQTLQLELDEALSVMRREVSDALSERVKATQEELISFIIKNGGTVNARIKSVNAVGATIPSSLLAPLSELPIVTSVLQDKPVQYELDVSMGSAGFDTWWNADTPIDGGAYDFGIIDSGVKENHPCLDSFSFYSLPGSTIYDETDVGLPDDYYPLNSHGTHVTGIVACTDATLQGGAFGIDKIMWGNSGWQATTMANMDDLLSNVATDSGGLTTADDPEVVNHSLGYEIVTSDYNANDAFYDAFVTNYDVLVTKSSGNSNWDDVDPTITNPASAYNIIVVANMDDQNTDDRNDDVRRLSSSVGPTIGGRKKPDITAPGTNIISTNANWDADAGGGATKSDYVSMSGTSMAAPHVAAAVLLLEQAGVHDPMAQKAVLINTADAWDSNETSATDDDGPVSGSHWDKSYGWGYLDMDEAYFNRGDYFIDSVVPRNDTAVPDDYILYKGKMYSNEKATMVWEKRSEGYVAGSTPSTQYALTDLNMRLYNENTGVEIDNDVDADDNVHQVSVGQLGLIIPFRDVKATIYFPYVDAVIKTYAWSAAFEGAASETYALATEENFVKATPPILNVTLTRPSTIYKGQVFEVTATVTNSGDVAAHGNSLELTLGSGFSLVSGDNPASLGTIAAGDSVQYVWQVQAPSILLRATTLTAVDTSNSYLETYTGSGSSIIFALADPPTIDLLVSSFSASPFTVKAGRDYTMTATVNNMGTAQADISTLRYYLSADETITPADTQTATDLVTEPQTKVGLYAGSSTVETATVAAPATPGTYYVGACVDVVANETVTDNQCRSVMIRVIDPYPDCTQADVIIENWTFESGDNFVCQASSSISVGNNVVFQEGSTSELYAPIIQLSPTVSVQGALTVGQTP